MRVLHLEDSRLDAVLVAQRLAHEWPQCQVQRASNREQFESALQTGNFDLILSDYSMEGYDGLSALERARQCCPNKPFIFFSGTIGEERGNEALRRGAVDFVIKDHPARLVPAIRRALAGPAQSRPPMPGPAAPWRRADSIPPMGLSGKSGAGEGILIIDDEHSLLELFSAVLTIRGYRVYKAASGLEGIRTFEANRAEIALVLTDLTMEGTDGVAVIRAVQASAPQLPILAMSGMAGTGIYDDIVRARGVPLLAKPIDRGTLLAAIRQALAARAG
jgi:CheY-like chemotaxis protein